jgi:hypothetical protein
MIRPGVHEMSPDIEEDVTQLMFTFAQNYEALFLSSVTILSLSLFSKHPTVTFIYRFILKLFQLTLPDMNDTFLLH